MDAYVFVFVCVRENKVCARVYLRKIIDFDFIFFFDSLIHSQT